MAPWEMVKEELRVFHRNAPLPELKSARMGEGRMRVASAVIDLVPAVVPEFLDLTEEAQAFVTGTGILDGQLTVHSLHTTAAVVVNEREPLLQEDMTAFLTGLVPAGEGYRHDDFSVRTVNMVDGESSNAHAHLRQLILGATKTLPVVAGRIALGQWQRIFFIELDQIRPRRVLLQMIGID